MQKTQDNVIMRPPSFEESELCIQHEPNPSSRGPHTGELHVLKRRKREGKNKKKKGEKALCQRMKLYEEESGEKKDQWLAHFSSLS